MNQNNGPISLLFNLLEERGISYAVLRNYETLPKSPLGGSDVDLLLNKKDKAKYFNVLKDAVRESGSYIIFKVNRINCFSCFIYQKDLGFGFWIDACTELSAKSFAFADGKFLLENRKRTEKGFFVIPLGGEAATVFVKEFFSGCKIKERYRLRIPGLAKNDKDSFLKALKPFFNVKTVEDMFQICVNGRWDKASRKRNGWFAGLVTKSILLNPFHQLFRFISFVLGVFGKFFSCNGAIIAFAGPDGVGKTTVCEKLSEKLKNIPFKNVRLYHGHFGFFPEWGNVYGKIFGKEKTQKLKESRRTEKTNFLYAVFSVLYYGLEYFVSWPWVFFSKMRGNFLIFDRYYYDFATLNTSSKFPLRLFRGVAKIIPHPDLVFIMLALPETIYKRKKELSLAEIDRQIEVFKKSFIPKMAPVIFIDGEKPADIVLKGVEEEIFKKLSQKIK